MGAFGWQSPFPVRLGGGGHANVEESYDSIHANLGDAFTDVENTATDAELKAAARALGGAAAALESFVAQANPRALSNCLARWEAILGLRAISTDSDQARRNRVSARLLANFAGDVDGISRIAAESFYPWTTNLRFNTLSDSVRYWPGGSNYYSSHYLAFDGVNDQLTIPHAASNNFDYTDSFSIGVWLRTSVSVTRIFYQKYGTYGVYAQMNSTGTVRFDMKRTATTDEMWVRTTTTINDGQWHYVVCSWNGSTTPTASNARIYIDGVEHTTALGTLLVGSDTLTSSISNSTAVACPWSGDMDGLAIFNYTLSSDNVTLAYNGGTPADLSPLNPVGWWWLGEGDTYPTITDHGSGANNATMTNMASDDIVATTKLPIINHDASSSWSSTVCMIVVEYIKPAWASDDMALTRRTACKAALDEYAPAWATFEVSETQQTGTHALAFGFYLNQPNIGVSSFA